MKETGVKEDETTLESGPLVKKITSFPIKCADTCLNLTQCSDTAMLAIHVLATLVEKGFEPDILPGVLGTLHHEIENW